MVKKNSALMNVNNLRESILKYEKYLYVSVYNALHEIKSKTQWNSQTFSWICLKILPQYSKSCFSYIFLLYSMVFICI